MEYAAMTPANQEADHPATDKCGYDRTSSLSIGVYVCACGWWNSSTPRYRFSKAPALIARVRELEGALESLVSVTDALAEAANLNFADKQLTAASKVLADKEAS